jgi:formylmethanofuran dehydrogenase subunit E
MLTPNQLLILKQQKQQRKQERQKQEILKLFEPPKLTGATVARNIARHPNRPADGKCEACGELVKRETQWRANQDRTVFLCRACWEKQLIVDVDEL